MSNPRRAGSGRSRARALVAVELVVLGCSCLPVGAAVRLRSGTVDQRSGLAPAALSGLPGGPELYVVAWGERADSSFRSRVESAGAEVVSYLPDRAWAIWARPGALATLLTLEGTEFVAPLEPGLRIAPELRRLPEGEPVLLEILLVPQVAPAGVAARLEALGLEVRGAGPGARFGRVVAELPAGRTDRLAGAAAVPGVFSVGPRPRYRLLNDTSIWVGQSGLGGGGATPLFDAGIVGRGEVVAVLDTGLDPDMCYFRDPAGFPPTNRGGATAVDTTLRKVIAYDFLYSRDDPANPRDYDGHGHGTHVAGSVAGDDLKTLIAHDAGDGMAPGAKLVIQDGGYATDNCADLPGLGCPVVDLTPIFQQAYDQGARLHTNSWGDRENFFPQNTYTAACVDADEFQWTHPDFLLLFAAGNSGSRGNDSVGSPSVAKNVVSVGATQRGAQADRIAGFSSRGWAADGRIKPTVTCPGASIVSARNDGDIRTNNCSTTPMSGTSMAAPTCAGLAALVRQYFADGYYPTTRPSAADAFSPSGALVKAVLINSARPMAAEAPPISRVQGFGRVTLADTLVTATTGRRLFVVDEAGSFGTGSTGFKSYPLEVVGPSVPFKVTLVWTDAPSNPLAGTNLVNDLDLVVRGPSGTWLGNVLAGGVSVPGGTRDSRNVEEQVLVPNPVPGTYTVEVRAASIPEGPQGFALVATGDLPAPAGVVYAGASLLTDAMNPLCTDRDGIPDEGETVRVGVQVLNPASSAAADVTVSLESDNPALHIVSVNPAALGSLAGGASGLASFDITVRGAGCREQATLKATVTSRGNLWPEEGYLPLVLERDRRRGDVRIDFEQGLSDSNGQDWVAQGGFQLSGSRANGGTRSLWAGVPPGPGYCDGSGSRDGASACATLLSPVFSPSGSSSLAIATWYRFEAASNGQWWDRGNLHVVDAHGAHSLLMPSGGRAYAGAAGDRTALCHIDGEDGWAGAGTSWATTSFDLSPWAGQDVRLELNYNTDAREICEGLYVDDLVLASVDADACDALSCSCNPTELLPTTVLLGRKGPGQGASFEWQPSAGAPRYHLNAVQSKEHLGDTDPWSPRQIPRGQGTLEGDTAATSATDVDALDPARPLLYYRALPACGPGPADEGAP